MTGQGNGNGGEEKHVPKIRFKTHHKVIRFGYTHGSEKEEYRYLHQRADLKVSRGDIPLDFLSVMELREPEAQGKPIYLLTRAGQAAQDEDDCPYFQISFKKDREILGASADAPLGWRKDLDELWSIVLAHFERKATFAREILKKLDADPFVVFGIDDSITQQALQKLKTCPALMCEDAVPSFKEWQTYLAIDPHNMSMKWLVEAFAETELPKPWTCYKGVGSIVCYIRTDTGMVTWKHPFYDHFEQLRDFCAKAGTEQIIQVRVNRLLWTYEATRIETEHDRDPLVCPEYIRRLADIFGYNVEKHGCLVRNLKAQIKVFAKSYRQTQSIDIKDICTCIEILARDIEKNTEMKAHWSGKMNEEPEFELTHLANGQVSCVNCQQTALCYCLECKDNLCLNCYDQLHNRGARLEHAPFRLVPCALCVTQPAKLHCTLKDKSLCHACYAMKHIKTLPADGKENPPKRIDYLQQYMRYANIAAERIESMGEIKDDGEQENYSSVLSTHWHPFYDVRGVKYYHNFNTKERMRQSPRREPNTADPGAEQDPGPAIGALANTASSLNDNMKGGPVALTGCDSLKTEPSAVRTVVDPESKSFVAERVSPEAPTDDTMNRTLRPLHRKHIPKEISAG
eukprot:TRINITY_DN64007_c0_g1_i1.p1 TRINITY_DN64007_c0_g1~~TRINITY_DN64007_c0_g1_i1.p1  ORF type:complete len:628 (+),score=125.35 TRINITY_DN64007_c0_g1_i1:106-1989(+)